MRTFRSCFALVVLFWSSSALGSAEESSRFVRASLDDSSSASFPEEGDGQPRVVPAPPPRLLRVSLDEEQQPLGGRLIRVSIDEGVIRYARLSDFPTRARRVRTTLD